MGYGKVTIGDREYVQFIPYPQAVRDGTVRCITCGQIDEDGYHDAALCPGGGGALPQTENVKAFLAANECSPVVFGQAYEGGGGRYRLKDGKSFKFTLYESRCMGDVRPRWDLPPEPPAASSTMPRSDDSPTSVVVEADDAGNRGAGR